MVMLAGSGLLGCEAVPDLKFEDPDAAVVDAMADGSTKDGSADAQVQEGGSEAGCTGTPPGGSNVCCTSTWCGGNCVQSDCATCTASCTDPTKPICCKLNSGNIVCKNSGPCPP